MKRRFLSLVLCALMLMSAFLVGCGEKTDEEIINRIASEAKQPYTLAVWIPTNDTTTAEAVQAVEDAINAILTKEFSTAIEIYAIKDSEYEQAVADRLAAIQALTDGGAESAKSIMDTKVKNGDVTVIKTEGGTYETVYPEVMDNQLDIFVVRSKADMKKYVEAKQIASIQSHIDGLYRNLTKVVYPTFFDQMKKDLGACYGVPVNHVIGEYTLAVIDKKLADAYEGDISEAATLADLKEFILWAKTQTSVALSADAADIASADADTFTALQEAGCVGTFDTAAVRIVKGDYVDLENYRKGSYVIKYQMPVATEEDVYASILAISTFSVENALANPRAIEFLHYLNTNEELKTLLQYGIEGVHYQLNYAEDDVNLEHPTLEIISDDYSMNTLYTGNIYKTYRGEGVTMADSWVTAKEQNLDSVPMS